MRNKDALDRLMVEEHWKSRAPPDAADRLAMGALALGAVVLAVTMALEWTRPPPFGVEAMEERFRLVAEQSSAEVRNPEGTCPL